MKRRLPLFLAIAMFGLATAAQAAGPRLVVWTKSKGKVSYNLSEVPITTFSGNQLIIRTSTATIPYERKDVLRYTYEDLKSTGISLQSNERSVEITPDGSTVTFRGLPAGTVAKVFAINGVLVEQATATDGAPLTLSIQNRPSGVYIIQAGMESIKLMKP